MVLTTLNSFLTDCAVEFCTLLKDTDDRRLDDPTLWDAIKYAYYEGTGNTLELAEEKFSAEVVGDLVSKKLTKKEIAIILGTTPSIISELVEVYRL